MRYVVEIELITALPRDGKADATIDKFKHRFGVETVAIGLYERCSVAMHHSRGGFGSIASVKLYDGDKVLRWT